MEKSKRKKQKEAPVTKGAGKTKKTEKSTKGQIKAAEYVSHLLKLHKLQGVLLERLKREV